MAQFKVPKSPVRNMLVLDNFMGVDFTNNPSAVSKNQCTDIENMIRDVPGKMRKCMGYHAIKTYTGRINGFHKYNGTEGIIHAGTHLYWKDDIIHFNMADEKSRSWKCDDKLIIADGSELIAFDGTDAVPVSEIAYVPTVTISKNPSGGGTKYEDFNLLQNGFTEQFLGTADDTEYYMSVGFLDHAEPKVQKLTQYGWVELECGVDFTVDYDWGKITFTTAPGVSPVTGEDNVIITAYKTIEGYADRINKCKIGIQYGVNGHKDRLFLAGNPDFVNYDWFCQMNDVTYWPDTNYSVVGSNRSAIIGYSIINNYLATHKDENESIQTIVLRSGEITDDIVYFKVVNNLQAESAIAIDSFAYLKTEPVYLTRRGIHAVTTPDSGEKYSQNRSFYLDGRLLNEPNLKDAVCAVHNDMYWLCVNGVAYILDGLQQLRTDPSEPYSTRQYAGFYRTNLPARVIWEDDNKLFFGTEDGKVCAFHTEVYDQESYYDEDTPVAAWFETPDLSGNVFYKNKTFRYLAIRFSNLASSGVKIEANKNGVWVVIKDYLTVPTRLIFSQTCFSQFSFAPYRPQKVISSKMRLKKVDKTRFRFSSDKAEAFEIYDIGLEFTENNNIK